MNVGDFVKHVRQGPGRIVQIHPEFFEVRSRAGNVYKVAKAVADEELRPVIPDGLTALLATRDPNAEYVLSNIVDVAKRIFRERRASSLPKKEIRKELEPIIKREGKPYATWWKHAQKKLFESGLFIPDSKKRTNIAAVLRDEHSGNKDWKREAENTSSPDELIDFARRFYAADLDSELSSDVASVVLRKAASWNVTHSKATEGSLESLLALLYVLAKVESPVKQERALVLDAMNFRDHPVVRRLDDDVVVGISLLWKLQPLKAVEWAELLIQHPSEAVRKRAFGVLNTDKYRLTLKHPLLAWLYKGADRPRHIDLFLERGFLGSLRREDKAALYGRLASDSEPSAAIRAFLDNSDNARIFAESNSVDPRNTLKSLSGSRLSGQAIGQIVRSLSSDQVLAQGIEEYGPGIQPFLLHAIRHSSWDAFRSYAWKLLELGQKSPDVLAGVRERLTLEMKERTASLDLLEAAALSCRVKVLQHDSHDDFDRAVSIAWGKLVSETSAVEEIKSAFKTASESLTANLKDELTAAVRRGQGDALRAQNAESEIERLKSIVTIVKTAAGEEKVGSMNRAVRDFATALLPVLDELQRRSDDPDRNVQLAARDVLDGLAKAGIVAIGPPGEVMPFDPLRHKLLEEHGATPRKVVVVRVGYVLREPDQSVIRSALVRPLQEEVQ